MNICEIESCDNEVYEKENECLLHCAKDKLSITDNHTFYKIFSFQLIDYIYKQMVESGDGYAINNKQGILKALDPKKTKPNRDDTAHLNESIISFTLIDFPSMPIDCQYNYIEILNKLKHIKFHNCKFWISEWGNVNNIDVNIPKVLLYDNCEFKNEWFFEAFQLRKVINELQQYFECKFNDRTTFHPSIISNSKDVVMPKLSKCSFEKELKLIGVDTGEVICINQGEEHTSISQLAIYNCNFNNNLIINNCSIENFYLNNSEIGTNSRFEFKNNNIKSLFFNRSNFYGLVVAFNSYFRQFKILQCNFQDFTDFEHCGFGEFGNENPKLCTSFSYVTFHNFVNFRNTFFFSGLNIETANFKEYPNFLNTRIGFANSKRETFRIIKYSFDKIGNHIEANRFYVLEMKKYKQELWKLKPKEHLLHEKIIFLINEKTSNFGESYIRPIISIIFVSIIYYSLKIGYEHNYLYQIYPPANEYISLISGVFNAFAKNIWPHIHQKFLHKGMEFISLCIYIINTSMIWLTIVAIKRKTKR